MPELKEKLCSLSEAVSLINDGTRIAFGGMSVHNHPMAFIYELIRKGVKDLIIFTDKAIFDFDPETKLARLKSIHPGVSLDDVVENTGYNHDFVPEKVSETPPPTDEELRLIREVIDPRGVLLPR